MNHDHDLIGKKFPVLDDGHVILLDYMGSDHDIVEAARTSYGVGTKKTSADRDLIRYLMRHRHSTPFEMAEIKLHIRMPMDSWRQMIRHRTANVNEYSTRYSEAIDSRQTTPPDGWRLQSTTNKQGSGGFVADWPESYGLTEDKDGTRVVTRYGPKETRENGDVARNIVGWNYVASDCNSPGKYLSDIEKEFHDYADGIYRERLKFGVAREQARKDLPLSTYTEAVWKCDLRNVLGFLSLRMDSHAQLEIRSYADIIGNEIVAVLFPDTWEAFRDYQLNSMTLSRLEVDALREILRRLKFSYPDTKNERERAEFVAKMDRLGVHPGD